MIYRDFDPERLERALLVAGIAMVALIGGAIPLVAYVLHLRR